ncbi:MAG: beta-glucosidase BglX [Bacteroidales bacterium]|nr:beta-glucosidase BglX [Bacteroidales bacterium]
MKKIITTLALCAAAFTMMSCGSDKSSGDKKMDKFIDDLMSKMTVEEKIGQLNLSGGDVPGVLSGAQGIDDLIKMGYLTATGWTDLDELRRLQALAVEESRMGIPMLCGVDVIHGFYTVFPIPLGLSCTWDPALVEKTARVAAVEASSNGISWTYSPMVDIARDARWGRIAEGSGEDPYLGSLMAAAMVRGYQGDDLSDESTIMACVKHFALYGAAEAGRDYNTVDMSKLQMYNSYLEPYKSAFQAGAGSGMSSFNLVEGIPASGNHWLMTELLRDEWGFNGFVVSDYDAIGEMTNHGLGDTKEVSAQALKAGLDMDMMTLGFLKTLKESLAEGKVSQKDIDTACRRILEAKYKLGLFDDPYKYVNKERAEANTLTEEGLALAREAAAKAIVLLKNDKNVLPLQKSGTVAVIGPLAQDTQNLLGMWSGSCDQKSATVVDAVKEALGASGKVIYAQGCNFTNEEKLAQEGGVVCDPAQNTRLVREAVAAARQADKVIAVLGEPRSWSGEACSKADITLPAAQKELISALLATGKPVVFVICSGRPLVLEWEDQNCPTLVEAWHGGSEAARGLADVIFGDVNPSGKLTTTFPLRMGQIPIYYNYLNTGRPQNPEDHYTSKYLDCPNEPLYPFGYGLSYTTFEYSEIALDKSSASGDKDVIKASVVIKNTGSCAGEETVQMYIGDPAASISRPVKELKGFQKLTLAAGESATVTFDVTTEALKFYNSQLQKVWEPGDFNIFIGTNSRDTQKASFVWNK